MEVIIFFIILTAIGWAASDDIKTNNKNDTSSSIDIDKENTDVTMKISDQYSEIDQNFEKAAILLTILLESEGIRTLDLSSSIDAYKRIVVKVIKKYNYKRAEEQLQLVKQIFITCTLAANGDVAGFIKTEFELLGV